MGTRERAGRDEKSTTPNCWSFDAAVESPSWRLFSSIQSHVVAVDRRIGGHQYYQCQLVGGLENFICVRQQQWTRTNYPEKRCDLGHPGQHSGQPVG